MALGCNDIPQSFSFSLGLAYTRKNKSIILMDAETILGNRLPGVRFILSYTYHNTQILYCYVLLHFCVVVYYCSCSRLAFCSTQCKCMHTSPYICFNVRGLNGPCSSVLIKRTEGTAVVYFGNFQTKRQQQEEQEPLPTVHAKDSEHNIVCCLYIHILPTDCRQQKQTGGTIRIITDRCGPRKHVPREKSCVIL